MKNNYVCGFCDCESQDGKDSNTLSCFVFVENPACNLAVYNLYFQAVQVIWQQICNVSMVLWRIGMFVKVDMNNKKIVKLILSRYELLGGLRKVLENTTVILNN